jgi:hypothetical protein
MYIVVHFKTVPLFFVMSVRLFLPETTREPWIAWYLILRSFTKICHCHSFLLKLYSNTVHLMWRHAYMSVPILSKVCEIFILLNPFCSLPNLCLKHLLYTVEPPYPRIRYPRFQLSTVYCGYENINTFTAKVDHGRFQSLRFNLPASTLVDLKFTLRFYI